LDGRFVNAAQVWLGPEQLDAMLAETRRGLPGLTAPLADVLRSSAKAETILVIDAAEHLTNSCAIKAKALMGSLVADNSARGCRVVIVGQTEAWANGELRALAGSVSPRAVEIQAISDDEVSVVLRATDGLQWLAAQDDAVSALTNLKALAWVMEGAARFQMEGGTPQLSLTAIADRLWGYWSGDKPSLQRLLMKLGEREASFEHSFALTSFDSAEVTELNALPASCPLRRGNNNRFQFQHDLAADWVRFQRLKEEANEVKAWAGLAGNPLWNNSLRMLGQFLLRQPYDSHTAWDVAFEEAEQLESKPLAVDILLDALFLDPNAESLLDERADMLFAKGAGRLLRLLRRFEHVASVPGAKLNLPSSGPDISLYIEAHYRTPIYVRWPAIARFLSQHRDQVVALMSPAVAAVCERWLTTTPFGLGQGRPMPFRKEFAEIALGSARELQVGQETRLMFLNDMEKPIYQAAFAGAADLPNDVAEWALEMVRRRPLRTDLAERVKEFRNQEAEEHRKKMERDAAYRKRHTERRSMAFGFPSGRKLPPWPLGPRKRVDQAPSLSAA
jgi:hypothetical protein